MTKKGCTFNGGQCYPIVPECEGCDRIVSFPAGKYCSTVFDPSKKWKNGVCNFATHKKVRIESKEIKLNPLKASKRSMGARA